MQSNDMERLKYAASSMTTGRSIKRVQRHRAEQGLGFVIVKKYNCHADHGNVPNDKENILKRDFKAKTLNRKWRADITYIYVQKKGEFIRLRSWTCVAIRSLGMRMIHL